jgi:hypothetical protein
LAAGASLLWRRQRVLWWLFAANLAVGILAAAPVRNQLRILDSSMAASDSLYHQMNLYGLVEAISRPEGLPNAFYGGSILLVLVYFGLLLFAVGGVLETFSLDRTLRFGEFLRASAEYFWRMVRLLIVFAILVTPLAIAQSFAGDLTDWLGSRSDFEQLGFLVTVAIGAVVALVGMAARVWIDVAQLDAVAQDQPAIRRSARRAWQLLRGNFWRVYGAVLAVQFFLIVITVLLLLLWLKLPHEAIGGSFVIGEVIVVLWLGFRLWQKAVECAWYQQRVAAESLPEGVSVSPPEPVFSEGEAGG